MKENNSVFETLFEVNVNEHVEKKNGLSYLSMGICVERS